MRNYSDFCINPIGNVCLTILLTFAGAFLGLGSGFGGAGFFYLGERREAENISTIDQRKRTHNQISVTGTEVSPTL